MTGRALVVQANALRLPLPDAVADLICTSPPYLWKRRYAISGAGEMGNEANWRVFLDSLWAATDEMLRCLKPSGSIFVNLGDTRVTSREPKWLGVPVKSRLLIPERYRVGCQDRYASQGVIVRQVQIWEKENSLPEAVKDRTRDSHEDWVQLVKRPDYYSAVDEIRQPYAPKTFTTLQSGWGYAPDDTQHAQSKVSNWNDANGVTRADAMHPLGKLPGSVWAVPSEPLRLPAWLGVDHYAAFPSELVRRIVLAFSPPGICLSCGQGRWPVVDRGSQPPEPEHRQANRLAPGQAGNGTIGFRNSKLSGQEWNEWRAEHPDTILGYACGCTPFTDHPGTGESSGPGHNRSDSGIDQGDGYATTGSGWGEKSNYGGRPKVGPWREYHLDGWQAPPTRPAVVLDPFSGTGTVGLVARALGRDAIVSDLSHPYCRAARYRIFDSGDAGKAISRTNLERQGSLL